MPRLLLSIAALLLFPVASVAQGIRMPPDFLPLEVGNTWRYRVTDADGRGLDEFQMEIIEHSIIEARSYYLFSEFPLAPDGTLPQPVAIRYDGGQRQYFHFDGSRSGELFPVLGASAEVIESDDQGLPLRARFDYGTLVLTLERGLGIVEAELETPEGPRTVTLLAARLGNEVVFEAEPFEPALAEPLVSDVDASDGEVEGVQFAVEGGAVLELEALPDEDGHRFLLRVRNVSEKLLAFDFASSQSYDFVVTDPDLGREVWRWSRRMFFSQVIRSEAIRQGGEWSFEVAWNYRDNNLNEVTPGTYLLLGVLTTDMPLEAGPIEFEVP